MSRARAGIFLLVLLGACATAATGPSPGDAERRASVPPDGSPASEAGQSRKPVYLVSHGWHTGIVVRRADLPAALWPEREDFPGADYLEVGWGDRDYYQSQDPGVGLMLKAGLWPTSSVLHLVAFSGSVTGNFPHSEVIELELAPGDFERLGDFVHRSFARDGAVRSTRLGPGLYGRSGFYPARETFHLFNTCNVWTARALRAGGLRITPFFSITTDRILSQARPFGRTIQSGPADD